MKKDALSELPLGIRDSQGNFTADPQGVAELYALEWKREWSGEDAIGFVKETNSKRALGEKHVAEARVWASNLDLRAENVRKACLSFPSRTAVGLPHSCPTMPWTLWARSSDNVLSSWPYQLSHFCNFRSCWARKKREQNYRHLAQNISRHHALGISTDQSMGRQVCR